MNRKNTQLTIFKGAECTVQSVIPTGRLRTWVVALSFEMVMGPWIVITDLGFDTIYQKDMKINFI